MDWLFGPVLILATLLCSLVAGLVVWFAVIVMPGIARLDDRAYIRAFQVMDGVIQRNHPLFMLAWVGSIPALLAAVLLGVGRVDGVNLTLLIAAGVIYFLGVQAPTFIVNIPMNNRLQKLDTATLDEPTASAERARFEKRWTAWNAFRSVLAVVVCLLLMVVLLRV